MVAFVRLNKKLSNKHKQRVALLVQQAMRAYLADQYANAEKNCHAILKLDSSNPDACNLLGKIAEKHGDSDKANECYLLGVKQHPKHLGLLASLALLSGKSGNPESAALYWQKLAELQPKNPDVWQAFSAQLSTLEQWEMAETAGSHAIKLAPKRDVLHLNMGRILHKQLRHDEAICSLNQAIKLAPDNEDAYYELAMVTLENGALDEAFETFNTLITLNTGHAYALFRLLRFKKATHYDKAMQLSEELIQSPSSEPWEKSLLSFGLGKAWEDLKDYDKSFYFYAEGNRNTRQTIEFDVKKIRRQTDETKKLFTAQLLAGLCADRTGGDELVFIVGMPRSGSTLISSILSAHPRAISTGESDILSNIVGELTNSDCDHIGLHNLSQISGEQLEIAAEKYRSTILSAFGKSDKYIDKALLNLWLCGFIHLLFPNAKILHCSRHPLDNCFSIFANPLEGSGFTFAYSMEEIGAYYRSYLDIMAHWRKVLPDGTLYDISNERLIMAPEEESRRIVEFCGLDWHESCLNFHTSKQIVQTSSLAQVRQPINNTSVERWKRFEKHLQPLIDALGDAV